MLVLFAILVSPLQFNGDQASVERGVLDGLQPGDRGRIYYLLSVNQREIRIDSTWASMLTDSRGRTRTGRRLLLGTGAVRGAGLGHYAGRAGPSTDRRSRLHRR